ncbi:pentapeptide repeat-containing protein [Streptomyces sp. NBC_01361]|uniref:pentapeptide repeat-containing protein n=1 Tax=Streptomyces sp. NBC_01361 TaxID=2903838 RepID=UPI002E3040C8|nr:pentapeptide repeat-containing protein [Streptomyces sp. NBC_01361]
MIRKRTERGLRLWPVGLVLFLAFIAALVTAGSVFYAAWDLLGARGLKAEPRIDSSTLFDLVKLSFGVVAGAGALVALIVAYRRQRVDEDGALREATRLHTERFTAAVTQLGDQSPAVCLGGVHSLAGLADDAPTRDLRQTCIDVLCAYLRLPYIAETDLPDDDAAARHAYVANREVRHTIIRLIRDHLRLEERHPRSWQGHHFDFTEVVFDGGDFTDARFTTARLPDGSVQSTGAIFRGARFSGGVVDFGGAVFSGGRVNFGNARFSGSRVDFRGARFSGGEVDFVGADFSGGRVSFGGADFSGGKVDFGYAGVSGGRVDFRGADFSSGEVDFVRADFSSGRVDFVRAVFSGSRVDFRGARFYGGEVDFRSAKFYGGRVDFRHAGVTSGSVAFRDARFSGCVVDLVGAEFAGGRVDFRGARFAGDPVDFRSTRFCGATVDFRGAEGTVAISEEHVSNGTVLDDPLEEPPAGLVLSPNFGGATPE